MSEELPDEGTLETEAVSQNTPAQELDRLVQEADLSVRVSIIPLKDDVAELSDLQAKSPGQRQGRQAMRAILAFADQLGVTLEVWPVWDENVEGGLYPDDLRKWYTRLGFGTIPNREDDTEYESDRYLVRRPLSMMSSLFNDMNDEERQVLKNLSFLGVGSAIQLKATDELLAGLEKLGLAQPRRQRDPNVKLWQPTRQGDALVQQWSSEKADAKMAAELARLTSKSKAKPTPT